MATAIKISELNAAEALALDDLIVIVDVSDISTSPSGKSKKVTIADLIAAILANTNLLETDNDG